MNFITDLTKVLNLHKYIGCLIEQRGQKFYRKGKEYNSLEEAKAAIDKTFQTIQNSIK